MSRFVLDSCMLLSLFIDQSIKAISSIPDIDRSIKKHTGKSQYAEKRLVLINTDAKNVLNRIQS